MTELRKLPECYTCRFYAYSAYLVCAEYPLGAEGDRGEDAKDKASTMRNYWVPGVNNLGTYGRWAFAEFKEVYQIQTDFEAVVEAEFAEIFDREITRQPAEASL